MRLLLKCRLVSQREEMRVSNSDINLRARQLFEKYPINSHMHQSAPAPPGRAAHEESPGTDLRRVIRGRTRPVDELFKYFTV